MAARRSSPARPTRTGTKSKPKAPSKVKAVKRSKRSETADTAENEVVTAPRDGVVVGVGLATCDLLCVSPRFDERRIELSVFSMQGGGATGTALATLGVLGAKTRFFGRLGDDHFGRFVL